MGTRSPLSDQCPFEADTAHLAQGHDLNDSEVPAFQTIGMSRSLPGDTEKRRKRQGDNCQFMGCI